MPVVMDPGSRFACPGRRRYVFKQPIPDTPPQSRGAMRPSGAWYFPPDRGRGECRVPVAPAASCAMCSKHTSVVTTVAPENTRHSRTRMVLTAYFALSPVTGISCHRHRLEAAFRKLDTSVGASGPHDFAVRVSAVRQRRSRVHRIPPHVRDDRERPSVWGGTGGYRSDLGQVAKENIFANGTGRPKSA